jgi:hypothetical protein
MAHLPFRKMYWDSSSNGAPGQKTMQLEEPTREFLLASLKKWVQAAGDAHAGIVFQVF